MKDQQYQKSVILLLSLNITAIYVLMFRIYNGVQLDIMFIHLVTGILLAILFMRILPK
jgi:hypothetical protein